MTGLRSCKCGHRHGAPCMYPGCGCALYRPGAAALAARVPAVIAGTVIREPAAVTTIPVREPARAGSYPDEYRAFTRVQILRRAGIWPGVIRHADGSCDLTTDPQEVRA